jgi:hypothetical protein
MYKANTLFLTSILTVLIGVSFLSAQDITSFELVDNDAVGLTVAPFEKWGMAVSDIDRNGYPDIFCIRWKTPGFSRIYMNNDGIFQDITDQSPVKAIEAEEPGTRTTLWVDYDNDGDRDLSMSTDLGIHLLRNDNNTFTDVSEEVGFVGQVPPGFIVSWVFSIGSWADYDLDGDLDCVVGQENNENLYLFRNDDGHFTNVASEAGLDATVMAGSRYLSFFDFDLDGDPDLYSRFHFFRNDDGVFTDITDEIGIGPLSDVMVREFFDYDNDGDFDYFKGVGDATAGATNEAWENRDGVYVNVSDDVGLTLSRDRYRSMSVGDFDNDADKDIFLQLNIDPSLDYLLVNDEVSPGVHAFANIAEFVGITKTGDRKGSVFFDYDADGFLDIYLPSAAHNHILYHNSADNGANWIGFVLEGTTSNRDAVGSLVTLYTGDKKQIYYTTCGNGWLRQDNPWVHFGIGFDTTIDSVVIRWPLGHKQVLSDVAINQYHEIQEPDITAIENKDGQISSPIYWRLEQNYPNPFNPTTKISYNLAKDADVHLDLYDITGKQVATLVDEYQTRGSHVLTWNGKDRLGNNVPSGVYFYKIVTVDFIESMKMILIR